MLFLDAFTALDFEHEDDLVTPLRNGQEIEVGDEFGRLVTISSSGYGQYGPAIFDSAPGGLNDPGYDADLLVGRGNVLILQEQQRQTVPGFFDWPDDSQLGGTLRFDFTRPVHLVSVDLIDICPGTPVQDVRVELFDDAGEVRTYLVPGGWTADLVVQGASGRRKLNLRTLNDQAGYLSTATASQSTGFDPKTVVRLDVQLSSSGAVDHLVLDARP